MRRPELPPGPFLVVGLARSGQAAALGLRERGEQVIGWDSAHPAGVESLASADVELHLGEGDGVPLVSRAATLVKSPGVPRGVSVIEHAQMAGLTVVGELELAWRMLPNEFVAVTGTNGKTTTVELIGHIYRVAGLPIAVAGNVGAALSGFVGRLDPRATVACEASSFQLEDAVEFAPEVAVLLNVAPDHLDRHGTLDAYTQAKLRVFAKQRAEDVAVLPLGLDLGPIPGAARRVRFGDGPDADLAVLDGALYWQGERLLDAREIGIPGRHNLQNAMAAAAACLARGVDPGAVGEGLRTFPGVAHRMEAVAELAGVRYVNDSKATNVASALVAIEASVGDRANIHLILGGLDKGQDFTPLAAAVTGTCRAVYLIGQDANLIARALAGVDVPVSECGTLERAVEQAARMARSGDVVLLSPACASLDQFVNYEARGERFRELVSLIRD
ncbi:MAG: UDP-N-acetylmuramoyl-L-alanine--D-glutamate ligase [Solirubrobacteraceae bacterium]